MKIISRFVFTGLLCAGFALTGCQTPPDDSAEPTHEDFEYAAIDMMDSLLRSGRFIRTPGDAPYVMQIGRVENLTEKFIYPELITSKISEVLTDSGQVFTTSARPDQTHLVKPELELSGKIISRNVRCADRGHQYEYYFQLGITDLRTGVQWWQREALVVKRTGRNYPRY